MTRRAPIPHKTCGSAQVESRRRGWFRHARALAFLALGLLAATLIAGQSIAQDLSLTPTIKNNNPNKPATNNTYTKTFKPQPGGIFGPTPKIDHAQPLYMQADQLLYDTKGSRVIAQGNVEIYYNNFILTADQVIYDQSVNKLIAEGNAQLKDPNGSITRADRFEALDDFRDAFIQSLSVVTQDDTRIAAERATRREGNVSVYEQAKFTPCKSDAGTPPLWCIGAARIVHDQAAATLTYQDAQFEFFGVPVIYLPYFETPDPSVKRRSGFLMPSFSNSSTLGYGFEVPYYFALAPNYDFTFHPRYWSKEGVLLQGDFRMRTETGQFTVKLAGIDQDEPATPGGPHGWRGSVETKGQFGLSSWWRFGWDVTVESDASFRRFYQLDPILQTDRINTVYLQGMSERNYFAAKLYQFGGLLLDDSVNTDSRVLPVIDYNYIFGQPVLGGELSFTGHLRSMTRTDGTDTNRIVLEANWRRQMIDPVGQVWTPFGNLRGDMFNYANARDPLTLAAIPDDTVFRGVAAAGVLYSYPLVAHTDFASHTIAPTAQLIVRQNGGSQARLPDEDARSLVFDDTLLFDIDKFSGYDRYETGTRANVGMQYTFQANNGMYGRAVFGQSFQLAGQNAFADPGLTGTPLVNNFNFNPVSGLQTDKSDYVAGVYLTPISGLNLISQSRFDSVDWSLRRQDSVVQGGYGPINGMVAYTYTHFDPLTGLITDQKELDASLTLKLTNFWSVSGLLRYDLDSKLRIQDQYQLKYADECFVLSVSYIETFITNATLGITPDKTVMLRFELKHIGDFGYSTNALNHVFGDVNQGPKL